MLKIAIAAALGLCISSGAMQPAQARGCIKGALVGGVAGHFAHRHTVLGAAVGCAVGVHEAHKQMARLRNGEQDRRQ